MTYSDYFEEQGFYKDIEEERKKISVFQNYQRFSVELRARAKIDFQNSPLNM